MTRQWKPNVTVAAIAERHGRFLMVEEQTMDGLRFNQPAGHLDPGESLLEASVRETLEETGHCFVPDSLVGIYQWPRPQGDVTYLRFAFAGEAGPHDPARPLDDGIVRALWLSRDDLRDCADRHRSPLVMQCVEDWCAGKRYDLSLIRHYTA
jgi:8-oxo-dGTP pyrophosphatase MutT (NUDIX family)